MEIPNLGPVRQLPGLATHNIVQHRPSLTSAGVLVGDASEESVLRDFDSNPDDGYIKMKQRVLAGLGLKPSMIDARPTQRTYDRRVSSADADSDCGLLDGTNAAPSTLLPKEEPRSQTFSAAWAAGAEPVEALRAVENVSAGLDEEDEVDGLSFDSNETDSQSLGLGVVDGQATTRGPATSVNRASGTGASALAECQPNAPALQAQSRRVGKRKAAEAVSRGLQAFRQHHSQQSALGVTGDEIEDDEADALDMP